MGTHTEASGQITAYNLLVIAVACFGSITYGYCACIIGTTLGQPTFIEYFNLESANRAAQLEGAMNGLFQGGGLVGTFIAGFLADKYGRRASLLYATVITIIGGALQAGSVHVAMYLVARFVTGFGIGGVVLLVPLWQSEVAPPHARGLLVGLHGVFILIGYNLATWLGVAFYYVKGSGVQWRVPLAIQVLPPLALLAGVPFIPESPRWLIENKKEETAKKILARLHGGSSVDTAATFVETEYLQIKTQLDFERSLDSSWRSIFTVPHYRKRALVGFSTLLGAQLTGTLVINNYGPSLYESLGSTGAENLILSGGYIALGFFGNILNAILLDRVGRKWLLATGFAGCCLALIGEIVMLAVFENTDNKSGKIAAVFFLYLHLFFFGNCIDGSTYVYASEIWPMHLRAKGFSLSIAGLFAGSLILLVSAPTAFNAIGWKFYIVMLFCTVFFTVAVAKYWPETKGLPLEEIAAKFGDDVTITLECVPEMSNGESTRTPSLVEREEKHQSKI